MKLSLDEAQTRPVVSVEHFKGVIDTGAESSVCNLTAKVIPMIFNVKRSWDSHIVGVGGIVYGKKFILSSLQVDDLTFKNVLVFAPDKPIDEIKQTFLLGIDMWQQLDCYYHFKNKEFVVNIPDNERIIDLHNE